MPCIPEYIHEHIHFIREYTHFIHFFFFLLAAQCCRTKPQPSEYLNSHTRAVQNAFGVLTSR